VEHLRLDKVEHPAAAEAEPVVVQQADGAAVLPQCRLVRSCAVRMVNRI
jgi:hypothetical protein